MNLASPEHEALPSAQPMAADTTIDWASEFQRAIGSAQLPATEQKSDPIAAPKAPETRDVLHSPAIAAAVAWQTREVNERSPLHRLAVRCAAVGGLATAASAALTFGTRGAQAYALARHGIDIGLHDQPNVDLSAVHSDHAAPLLLAQDQGAASDGSDMHLVEKGGIAFYVSDTQTDTYVAVANNDNTHMPDTATIVAQQELAKVAYYEDLDDSKATLLVHSKTAIADVRDAFVKDNDITAPDGQLVAGQSYETDAADHAAYHEYNKYFVAQTTHTHTGDSGDYTGGSESYDNSTGAETITKNEGWYHQFRQMGIHGSNSQLHSLLHAVGPELHDQGVAYWDHRHGGFWGMRLVNPDSDGSGYHHTSTTGHIRDEDLDYIMRVANQHGLLHNDHSTAPDDNYDSGSTSNTNENSNQTGVDNTPTDQQPTVILPEPEPTTNPTTLQQLTTQQLERMGITDPAIQQKVANEVASDPALLAQLRHDGIIPADGYTLNLTHLQKVGHTLVLPPDVRDDFYASVQRNVSDDLPGYNAAAAGAQQAQEHAENFWDQVVYDWRHFFNHPLRDARTEADPWFERNWPQVVALTGIVGLMAYDEYHQKPLYYAERAGSPYAAPGFRVRQWRDKDNWRNWTRPSSTPYPRPWRWNRVASTGAVPPVTTTTPPVTTVPPRPGDPIV
jgi:hypothetical protein